MFFILKEYISTDGKNHFRLWLDSLELTIKAKIQVRLFRVENGNLGDCKSLGDGVYELRFMTKSGYRVYFGKEDRKIILLLAGGDKSSQQKDIKKAKALWLENKER